MKEFTTDPAEFILISRDTPLISNLDMIENIALIQEVHHALSIKKADAAALENLKKLNLESIARKRVTHCSANEILYVMLIRALMMPQKRILLQTPYSIVNNLGDIKTILSNISKLDNFKEILILDVLTNKYHYEGVQCTIVK